MENLSCVLCVRGTREEVLEYYCIFCICCIITLSHLLTKRAHLVKRAANHHIATNVVAGLFLEAEFGKGTPQPYRVQLLRDTHADNLHGHTHRHEFAWLCSLGRTEVKLHQLNFQSGGLEFTVMLSQALGLCLREPELETVTRS